MTERQIADGLCAYLRKEGLNYIQARTDKRSTIAAGWVDVTVIYRGGVWLCELKTPTGKLSQKQKDVHAKIRANGTPVHVCRSVQEAVESVQEWLGLYVPPDPENTPTEAAGSQKGHAKCQCGGEWHQHYDPLYVICSDCRDVRVKKGFTPEKVPPENLWVANLHGVPWVFSGDPSPGGIAQMVRVAQPADILNLKRT